MTSIFLKMEDDLNFFQNGRRPDFFQLEDDLNIILAGRQPQKIIMQAYAIISKTMVVAPLRVT